MAAGPVHGLSYSGPETHTSSESDQSSELPRQEHSPLPPPADPSTLPSRMNALPSKDGAAPTSCWAQREALTSVICSNLKQPSRASYMQLQAPFPTTSAC